MSARGWSGTGNLGTPPMNVSVAMMAPTQSEAVCCQVAQA
jgi:hypothetical protein